MSAEEGMDESAVPDQDQDQALLLRFGKLPTEPLLAKDRNQAFRFLAYGKGTRCVVTEDLYMMLCVGRLGQVKEYARGWIRAHRRLANVVVARAQEPKLLQMVISLDRYGDEEDEYGEGDEGMAEVYDDEEYDIEFDEDLPEETIDDFMDSVRADEYAEEDGPDMDGDMVEGLEDGVDGDGDETRRLIPPHEITDADDHRLYDALQAYGRDLQARRPDDGPCANCGSTTHILMECNGPLSPEGPFMTGCPLHNTKEHELDECPVLDSDPSEILVSMLYTTLVCERAGKPAFRSERFPWTKAMLIARTWGMDCEEPFPWSADFAAAQRAEREAAPKDQAEESKPVADPVTADWEAVKTAIEAGAVPDPGDVTPWLPPAEYDPMITEDDDTYEFLGIQYQWPKREAVVHCRDVTSDDDDEEEL